MSPIAIVLIIVGTLVLLVTFYLYLMFGFGSGQTIYGAKLHPNWMSNIDDTKTLHDIVLPGTHDSLIFDDVNLKINYQGPKSGFVNAIQKLSWLPGLSYKIAKWSKTQGSDIQTQLEHGIRSFDVRVVMASNSTCRGIHSFVASDFELFLTQILKFLTSYPTEFLLIRYRSESATCDQMFVNQLGALMVQNTSSPLSHPIQQLRGKIIISLEQQTPSSSALIPYYFSQFVHHDWLNTFSLAKKKSYIKDSLAYYEIDKELLFNLDWTLTPQTTDVILGPYSLKVGAQNINSNLDLFLQ